jgi:transcriptional regulator GlxA family with amidase domain
MDPRIAQTIDRMEQDLDEDHNIDTLAAAVNLSASRLAHLFTRETGRAPARYLRELRMQRAKVLLERTFLSVKQVMACVGVNDPSHFARDFRRFHGVPPSHLRIRSAAADAGRRSGTLGTRTAADGQESPPPMPAAAGNENLRERQTSGNPGENDQ